MQSTSRRLVALSSSALLAFAALGSAPASAQKAGDAKPASADVSFMKEAAEAGRTEIEASQMAAGKAGSDKVKTFAQQMVDDHTKAAGELAALAQAKGVELPVEPSLTQRAQIKLLSGMSGPTFDRGYAKTIGVSAHEATVMLFRTAAGSAKDPDVKAFAQKTLPTLQHHLDMARELKDATEKMAIGKPTRATL